MCHVGRNISLACLRQTGPSFGGNIVFAKLNECPPSAKNTAMPKAGKRTSLTHTLTPCRKYERSKNKVSLAAGFRSVLDG